ncbi:hypothetical protein DET49_11683 [Salegentibacter sp. 24]|nr:hypothetical protein DET49_11683 [Salegentibacter sp. 24]
MSETYLYPNQFRMIIKIIPDNLLKIKFKQNLYASCFLALAS